MNVFPILACEGTCRRPTRHQYVGTEQVEGGVKIYYECETCRTLRQWGLERLD